MLLLLQSSAFYLPQLMLMGHLHCRSSNEIILKAFYIARINIFILYIVTFTFQYQRTGRNILRQLVRIMLDLYNNHLILWQWWEFLFICTFHTLLYVVVWMVVVVYNCIIRQSCREIRVSDIASLQTCRPVVQWRRVQGTKGRQVMWHAPHTYTLIA